MSPQSERWRDCDQLEDPIARIDCRLSHMNDGFHVMTARLDRVEWQQRFLLAGAFSAVATGIVTVLRFAIEMRWL